MIVAIIAVSVVSVAALLALGRELRVRDRAWQRREMTWESERRMLLDRMMYLVDKPWDTVEPTPVPEMEDHYYPSALDSPTPSAFDLFDEDEPLRLPEIPRTFQGRV